MFLLRHRHTARASYNNNTLGQGLFPVLEDSFIEGATRSAPTYTYPPVQYV